MNKNNKLSIYIYSFCLVSYLFPLSTSRLLSTWDFPSEYSLTLDYVNDSQSTIDSDIEYDVNGGFSFSYEHAFIRKAKFNFYLGSEIMLGKKSNITLAFHSLYLMPTLKLNENADLLLRFGYSNLNTDDDAMPTDAFMYSIGSEIKISDDWSINFFNTWYETNDKDDFFQVCPTPSTCSDEPLTIKASYEKFSVSLVYELPDKEKSTSSSSKGRVK